MVEVVQFSHGRPYHMIRTYRTKKCLISSVQISDVRYSESYCYFFQSSKNSSGVKMTLKVSIAPMETTSLLAIQVTIQLTDHLAIRHILSI